MRLAADGNNASSLSLNPNTKAKAARAQRLSRAPRMPVRMLTAEAMPAQMVVSLISGGPVWFHKLHAYIGRLRR